MDEHANTEPRSAEATVGERLEWSAPQLERLDFDGTEVDKNPSTFENPSSYPSPAIS